MKLTVPIKPRKGLTLVSDERHTDKRGNIKERVTVWRKNDQSNALPVEKEQAS